MPSLFWPRQDVDPTFLSQYSVPPSAPTRGSKIRHRSGSDELAAVDFTALEEAVRQLKDFGRGCIDPDTGAPRLANLAEAMETFIAAMPALPADAGATLRRRHAKLLDGLRVATKPPVGCEPHEAHLHIRDALATAARRANKLARTLTAPWSRAAARDPEAAAAWRTASALLRELKRVHLSAAAPGLIRRWAAHEGANVARAGFHANSPGDTLTTSGGVDASFGTGAFIVGGAIKKGVYWFVNDDDNAYVAIRQGRSAEGGIGARIGDLKAKLVGRISVQEGDIVSRVDAAELAQVLLNREADRAVLRSAGPRARALRERVERTTSCIAKAFGRHYTRTPGAPLSLGQDKIAKGLNRTRLEVLAESLDGRLAKLREARGAGAADAQPVSTLMRHAYPSAASTLAARLRSVRHAEGASPLKLPLDTLHRAAPVSNVYPSRNVGYRSTSGGIEGVIGNGGDGRRPAVELNATLGTSVGTLNFYFLLPRLAHELLDMSTFNDPRQTLALLGEIDALADGDAPPSLHLYRRMRERLSGTAGAGDAAATQAQAGRYGKEVPAQFVNTIGDPSEAALDRADQACDELTDLALALQKYGPRLLASPDRALSHDERKHLQEQREDAFRRLSSEVWDGRYPGGQAAALADPRSFVARSLDAIGLALGCAGAHRAILAERLGFDAPGDPRGARSAATHRNARDLLGAVGHLTMHKRDAVDRHASVRATAVYERCDFVVNAGVSVRLGRAPTVDVGDAPVSLTNPASALDVRVEASFMRATQQVKACRLGDFVQLTLRAQSGLPLVGKVLERALFAALERLFPGADAVGRQFDLDDLRLQLQALAMNVEAGAGVIVKFRRPPGLKVPYALQYVRGIRTVSGGFGRTLNFGPLQIGLHKSSSAQTCRVMLLGDCLGKHIMQWPKAKPALGQTSFGERLAADPRLANAYLGIGDMIPTMIERRIAAWDHGGGNEPLPNEFAHYLWSQRYRDARGYAGIPKLEGAGYESGFDWQAAHAHIRTLDSVQERLAYYCGEGRPVFEAFCRCIDDATSAHTAAMVHRDDGRNDGFATRLANGLAPDLRV